MINSVANVERKEKFMNKKNLLKVSLISFLCSAFVLTFNYFFFHYFTDEGFSNVFHEEAGKPFVADLIGQLGVLLLFLSISSLIFALVVYKNKKD